MGVHSGCIYAAVYAFVNNVYYKLQAHKKDSVSLQITTSHSDIALDNHLARMRFRSANYSEKVWARWALCYVTCTCRETAIHENFAEVKTSSFHC